MGTAGLSDIAKLSSAEKAKGYRQLAERARRNAIVCPKHLKEAYLRIAQQWDDLATMTEMLAERAMQNPAFQDAVPSDQQDASGKKRI